MARISVHLQNLGAISGGDLLRNDSPTFITTKEVSSECAYNIHIKTVQQMTAIVTITHHFLAVTDENARENFQENLNQK
jgi:hypothetical protein